MFSSILVPIDTAQPSSWQAALSEAAELARSGGAVVTVMTVVREMTGMLEGVYVSFQVEQMLEDARAKLAKIVREIPTMGVSVRQEARYGSICHEILATAKDIGADLIVMASHRPELRDYLIGPNAAYVAQHATCSVLVLRRVAGRSKS